MKYTYEVILDELGSEILKRTDENEIVTWIPLEFANSDYQQYLESLKDAEKL